MDMDNEYGMGVVILPLTSSRHSDTLTSKDVAAEPEEFRDGIGTQPAGTELKTA
jgi:hypothetical protein